MLKKITLCAVVLLAFAAAASAALSKEYADFPKSAVQYLLTKDEVTEWKSVQTDEQAKAFIDKFWARRDPTPGTPANEFRDSFTTRAKIADERFHTSKVPGSATDRGKVFMVLGGPTKLRRSRDVPASTIQAPPGGMDRNDSSIQGAQRSPREIWVYEQAKVDIKLGQPVVEVTFVDQYGVNDWKVERQGGADIFGIFENVARSYIVQPSATASVAAAAAPVPTVPPPMAFKNDALRTAIDDIRAGKATVAPNLYLSVGEFVTPAGEDFVPVQLYLPASAGLAAGAPVTFFGRVEKAGETVALFEDPASLTATNGGVYVARSISLAPGDYQGTFGIAREGQAPVLVSATLNVAGLDKDAPAISPLILSNHVYPLTTAQGPTDPYSFGGLRVVPKSDATFRPADELWYFFELRNPGIDPASNAPKVTLKLSVTGKTAQGADVSMAAPAEETPAQELKGVPGHWGIGQAMPLETFKPGDYNLAVKVTDLISKRTYELKGQFRIVP
ncbi:MAG TPA: GWxTD domain-containing protein [Thermoanaerobaculia bacterium]|nr:GWxTD domain-containing protein [Thermoanaerobaculia bacterium]